MHSAHVQMTGHTRVFVLYQSFDSFQERVWGPTYSCRHAVLYWRFPLRLLPLYVACPALARPPLSPPLPLYAALPWSAPSPQTPFRPE